MNRRAGHVRVSLVFLLAWPAASCGKAVNPGGEGTTGGELCFNGEDDDQDDMADCADPNCGDVARCVPVADRPGLEPGTLVPVDDPCPDGFEETDVVLHQGIDLGECSGCECEPGATTCTATAWSYTDATECSADEGLAGGTQAPTPVTFECPTTPHFDGFLGGWRVDVVSERSCTASGAGLLGEPGWERTMKFCRAALVGGGCDEGELCVSQMRRPETQCALAEGEVDCIGYAVSETDWYTGFGEEDTRTCAACSCTALGGSCDGVEVLYGNDWACGPLNGTIADGSRTCVQGYSPPLQLSGTPSPPTGCVPQGPVAGEIAVVGQHTLCCDPE